MKNLYLVTTASLGDFYVLAESISEAESGLKKVLDDQSFGSEERRVICNIKRLAEGFGQSPYNPNKPYLWSNPSVSDHQKRPLLIVADWIEKGV